MNKKGFHVITIIIVVVFVAAIAIPSFVKARNTSCQNSCINNMRLIDGGKEQWAMVHNKDKGDSVVTNQINRYIRNSTTPRCSDGGYYIYNQIGEDPECSLSKKPKYIEKGGHTFSG